MLDIAGVSNGIILGLSIALFAAKAFALADCIGRRPAAFPVGETLPKQGWLVVLGLALAVHLINWNPVGLLNLIGSVAALVYLAQLRGNRL